MNQQDETASSWPVILTEVVRVIQILIHEKSLHIFKHPFKQQSQQSNNFVILPLKESTNKKRSSLSFRFFEKILQENRTFQKFSKCRYFLLGCCRNVNFGLF